MNKLTRDNPHYQVQTPAEFCGIPHSLQSIAQGKFTYDLLQEVRNFAAGSVSLNTRRAYASDLRKFQQWGGSVPSDPQVVATYLAAHARTHSVASLRRWTASISRVHTAAGHTDPTKFEPVVSTLKGICRTLGKAPTPAQPLLREDLSKVLDAIGERVRDKRDLALLLLGFAGGFRRSELVALDLDDIQFLRRGMLISIRRSKTDQEAKGRQIAVPFGRGRHCPVAALEKWLEAASITTGPLFRPVRKDGRVPAQRLSGEAVARVVKERVAAIGIEPSGFSGHSLRAGFATSAAQAGVSSWKIRQQTGHASDAMLSRYILSVELFEGNAAAVLL